jgi:hypothetical protein
VDKKVVASGLNLRPKELNGSIEKSAAFMGPFYIVEFAKTLRLTLGNNPDIALMLNNLVMFHQSQVKLGQAWPPSKRALAIVSKCSEKSTPRRWCAGATMRICLRKLTANHGSTAMRNPRSKLVRLKPRGALPFDFDTSKALA